MQILRRSRQRGQVLYDVPLRKRQTGQKTEERRKIGQLDCAFEASMCATSKSHTKKNQFSESEKTSFRSFRSLKRGVEHPCKWSATSSSYIATKHAGENVEEVLNILKNIFGCYTAKNLFLSPRKKKQIGPIFHAESISDPCGCDCKISQHKIKYAVRYRRAMKVFRGMWKIPQKRQQIRPFERFFLKNFRQTQNVKNWWLLD